RTRRGADQGVARHALDVARSLVDDARGPAQQPALPGRLRCAGAGARRTCRGRIRTGLNLALSTGPAIARLSTRFNEPTGGRRGRLGSQYRTDAPRAPLGAWHFRYPISRRTTMGFFSKILDKLGIGSAQAAETPAQTNAPTGGAAPAAPAQGQAIPVVDVVAQLEQRAAANPQKLNWRTSIVDLLKLLDIDSSLSARKELATELGCPANLMSDSAQMNMWLHKKVLERIAANGGNVPADLLD